ELAHHLLVETVHGGLVKENYKPAIIAETYASTGAAPWRCPGTGSGVVVAVEDVAYQATAHDVGAFEGMHVDTGQAAHTGNGVLKAVGPADVALADVAVDDDTRILADAGEEHLHLRGRGVLRLVEDDEGVVAKGLAAHVGQRCPDDAPVAQAVVDHTAAEAFVENVTEGIDVHRVLVFELPGQKAQLFAGFHRRAGEDDAFDAPRFQRLGGERAGTIGFAGASRADAEGEAVVLDGVDVALLCGGAGAEGTANAVRGVG